MKRINFLANNNNLFFKFVPLIVFVVSLIFQVVLLSSDKVSAELENRRQTSLLASLNLQSYSTNCYSIKTADDLKALSKFHEDGGNSVNMTFRQEATIDLSGSTFTPIGTSSYQFKGKYYGQNYLITGLTINSKLNAVGLFGYSNNAQIYNVILGSGSVNSSGAYTGAIVGCATNNLIMDHCFNLGVHVSVNKTETKQYIFAGGLVGYISASIAITSNDLRDSKCYLRQCYNSANVSISTSYTNRAGGLVGYADRVFIRDSMNLGDVNATTDYEQKSSDGNLSGVYTLAGGIAGVSYDCSFWGDVNGGDVYSKGITIPLPEDAERKEENVSTGLSAVYYSYKVGKATHESYASMAGGIAGQILDNATYKTSSAFTTCINNGDISAPCKKSYTTATVLSYIKAGERSALDRLDLEELFGNKGIEVSVENAFQIGYNYVGADLSSCYYLDKTTADVKTRLNMRSGYNVANSTYKYMIAYAKEPTNNQGMTQMIGIDTTLSPSNYSKYNNTNYGWTAGKKALESRSSKSLEFTLTKTGFDSWCKNDYNTLTKAQLTWSVLGLQDPDFVGPQVPGAVKSSYIFSIEFVGTYYKTSGALFWKKEWAEPKTVSVPILSTYIEDLETAIGTNCTGATKIERTDEIIEKLGSKYWTMDENINNGYPIQKFFLWEESQSKPK